MEATLGRNQPSDNSLLIVATIVRVRLNLWAKNMSSPSKGRRMDVMKLYSYRIPLCHTSSIYSSYYTTTPLRFSSLAYAETMAANDCFALRCAAHCFIQDDE
ncbi:hypothetical protein SAY86_031861 [Trapa natans]|uniref:Uncharacterized protein n=1 Tax=Trapa natans TaxID=22666 RepID=A0AAN7RA40_TRANT|nr:hypothetical protein SAY86_031861 [Trapa natans]